jgi:hypothetical protein
MYGGKTQKISPTEQETLAYMCGKVAKLTEENDTLKKKVAKLKSLMLLTDPVVSHVDMTPLATVQWMAYLYEFPDEG